MRAIRFDGPGDWVLAEVPAPEPGPDELLIKVEASGVCGTDLRIATGDYGHLSFPLVPGHEFAGTVAGWGEGVEGYAVGDPVAADPNIWCGRCEWCRRGAPNLCAHWEALGITRDGALAEYVTVPARLAVPLAAGLDPATGALIEPLSCVLHGFDRGGVEGGRSMIIYGGGAIGLLAVAVAADLGAEAYLIEPHARRRERGLELGARGAAGSVTELAGPAQFDLVLDASGAPAAVADGLSRLRKRGTFLQMGVLPTGAEQAYSPYHLYEKEWRIIGSNSVADQYPAAAAAMGTLAPRLRGLITHEFDLADFDAALAAMASADAIKVQLRP
ncbi:2-desacetyl-2-hydroxyethyl bacteriochlorophyllide A dehydrogenase [Naumannella cuiyingiana]|uniref:2-desacetyl-2-hydroxyethyl bacteriochlorophyllide A dehydrogenase n=1 Tax=Naumannella cuiyingiana TaxID=1347891 RepID=A0A7Z0D7U9_9ACTN|nr:2-desacetyl-2-hydroxyethyl bacteriochlorophyllide A dehydrogenase [Naumannella cuiyingiana]